MYSIYSIYILNHCFQSSPVINCSCLSVPSVNVSCPFSQSSVIAPYCSLVFQPICHCSCNCFLSYLSLHLQLIPFLPVTPYATDSFPTCHSICNCFLAYLSLCCPFLPVTPYVTVSFPTCHYISFPTCHSICNWFLSFLSLSAATIPFLPMLFYLSVFPFPPVTHICHRFPLMYTSYSLSITLVQYLLYLPFPLSPLSLFVCLLFSLSLSLYRWTR